MAKQTTTNTPTLANEVFEFQGLHVMQMGRTGKDVAYHYSVTPDMNGVVTLKDETCMGMNVCYLTTSGAVALGNALTKTAQTARELARKTKP